MKRAFVALLAAVAVVAIWKNPFGFGRGGSSAAAAQLSNSFTVVNSGFTAWNIDGNLNPTLNLNIGQTYSFNVSAIGHPFFIKTMQVTGSGSQWTEGTANQGVQSGTLTFTVPNDAPSQLFYQCGVHAAMTGTLNILGPVDVVGPTAKVAWLGRATPNPAHDGATFRFGLPHDARIDISMFDARGRRVRVLWAGVATAGEHSLRWDGRDDTRRVAPSGLYFYRLTVEGRVLNGRVLVAR